MATNFPTGLDDFTNYVDGTTIMEANTLNNMQFAIEALEAKVGIDSSAVVPSHDYKIDQLESNPVTLGSWVSDPSGYATSVTALTDGFVVAITTTSNVSIDGYTPIATLRTSNTHSPGSEQSSITMPVKSGDTWKVTGSTSRWWIPLS